MVTWTKHPIKVHNPITDYINRPTIEWSDSEPILKRRIPR